MGILFKARCQKEEGEMPEPTVTVPQPNANNQPPTAPPPQSEPPSFDAWLKEQADPIKAMMENHTHGLKSALQSEREAHATLEKQVRDLAAKAEKDSDAQTQLTKLADEMSETNRKAEFYEAAHAAGVANLKLAYLAATQDGLFDKRGVVNFESMKQSYPELFGGKKPPPANPGEGTGGQPPKHQDMNDFLLRAAGRK